MVVATSCKSFEAADASAWNFRVRTSMGTTCSANGMMKCKPSPRTRFSTAPTYKTTPLCPASTTTTDSNITTIITTNVIIPATTINLLDDLDPEYWDGLRLPNLLNGFFIRLIF